MNPLRHLLLVVLLVVAQLTGAAHAVSHVTTDDGGLPDRACELCLASHDLGTALPTVADLPPRTACHAVPEASVAVGRASLPAPRARQGAPPSP